MSSRKTGFYGKLPDKGDFVGRRLPTAVVEPWDAWLRQGLAASQEILGPGWLDFYLKCPIWRFALSPGLCGPEGVIGILMASVDRVSRYFPLTLAVPIGTVPPAVAAVEAKDWFAAAEPLALEALGDDFDFEGWDLRIEGLDAPDFGLAEPCSDPKLSGSVFIPLGAGVDPRQGYPMLLGLALQGSLPVHSLWWTAGSTTIPSSLALSPGLPEPNVFSALLSGARGQTGGRESAIQAFTASPRS